MPDHCFCYYNPGITVAENGAVFLLSRRIRSNLSQFWVIGGIRRLYQHDPIRSRQIFFYRIQSFLSPAVVHADSAHDTEALWFDKNFSFFAGGRSHFLSCSVVCSQKPLSIPAERIDSLIHGPNFFPYFIRLFFFSQILKHMRIFCPVFHIHSCNIYRFCNLPFGWTGHLKAFTRFHGKAVQIQTVIPVCPSDLRKSVRSKMSGRI